MKLAQLKTLHEDQAVPEDCLKWLHDHWDDDNPPSQGFERRNFKLVNGAVNSNRPVFLTGVDEIPFPFGEVKSFETFSVTSDKKLRNLKNSPRKVHEEAAFSFNQLVTLEGAPEWIGSDFNLGHNFLTTLEHFPAYVGGSVILTKNRFQSLAGVHKHIRVMNGHLDISGNPLKSHLLGVLLIDGCTHVVNYVHGLTDVLENEAIKASNIINKHFGKGRAGVLAAQQELLDAGLEEYAQL